MGSIAERRALRGQTRQLLTALGDNADQVASSLAAEGVHGRAHSPQGCAVAVYLQAVVAADRRVRSVIVTSTRLGLKPESRRSPLIVVPLPRAVRQFVAAFDAEKFPQLLPITKGNQVGTLTREGRPPSPSPAGQ